MFNSVLRGKLAKTQKLTEMAASLSTAADFATGGKSLNTTQITIRQWNVEHKLKQLAKNLIVPISTIRKKSESLQTLNISS